MVGPFGGGWFHGLFQALMLLAAGFAWFLGVVVAIGVTVLLVRFLWIGTKAAKRYLELHPATAADADEPEEPAGL